MDCIATIKFGDQKMEVRYQKNDNATPYFNNELVKAISDHLNQGKNEDSLKAIVEERIQQFKDTIKKESYKPERPVKIQDLIPEVGKPITIPNYTTASLGGIQSYRALKFPSPPARLLIIQDLDVGGQSIANCRIQDPKTGEEIYIVNASSESMSSLAGFLTAKHAIETKGVKFAEDYRYYNELNELVKQYGLADVSDLLAEYQNNKRDPRYNRFIKSSTGDQLNIRVVLKDALETVIGTHIPVIYNDAFTRNIYANSEFTSRNNEKYFSLSMQDVILALENTKFTETTEAPKPGDSDSKKKPKKPKKIRKSAIDSLIELEEDKEKRDELSDSWEKFKNSLDKSRQFTLPRKIKEYLIPLLFLNESTKDKFGDEKTGKILEAVGLPSELDIKGDVILGKVILEQLCSVEPEFSYYVSEIDYKEGKQGISLKLKRKYPPIMEKYPDMNWDEVTLPSIHRGYKVYKFDKQGQVVISPYYISKRQSGMVFPSSQMSEKDINRVIDQQINNQEIGKHSMHEVNSSTAFSQDFTIDSYTFIPVGSIIEVVDVEYDSLTTLPSEENNIRYQKMSDFMRLVDNWEFSEDAKNKIKETINTPQLVMTFLYKLNEVLKGDRKNSSAVIELVNKYFDPQVRKTKLYYVDSIYNSKNKKDKDSENKKYNYRLYPITGNKVKDITLDYIRKGSKAIPVKTFVKALSETLAKDEYGGLKIQEVTNASIKQDPSLQDTGINLETDKAFIANGQIYINTTLATPNDLMHEYTHLVLGLLKSNPDLRENYEQLMQLTRQNMSDGDMNSLRERYPNLTEIDLAEEYFCNMFGGYVLNRLSGKGEHLFRMADSQLKSFTSKLFNTEETVDIKEFYGRNRFQDVMQRVYDEIGYMLAKNKGIDFSGTEVGRRYSNYISENLRTEKNKKGTIIENCG